MKFLSLQIAILCLLANTLFAEVKLRPLEPQFTITIDGFVLGDIPVSKITIRAHTLEGDLDPTFNGQPLITGIRREIRNKPDVKLGPFKDGELVLESSLKAETKVYVIANEIVVDPEGKRPGKLQVVRVFRWLSILPPILAIILAIWSRNVLIALFAAVWSGAIILAHGDVWPAFLNTFNTFLIGQIAASSNGSYSHLQIILFTIFLGALVGVMSKSGGTMALVESMKGVTRTRERGQLMTWFLGLVIFFDDHANSMLVGSSMRPVTDRLKISREKLAFLIDATAAPIAGLALVSTWVGVELTFIEESYTELGLINAGQDVFTTFLYTIPFRFYPLHLLVFVMLIAYSGNDFGLMHKAESRALSLGQLTRPGAHFDSSIEVEEAALPGRRLLRNALLPLAVLLIAIITGLIYSGWNALAAENVILKAAKGLEKPLSIINIISGASANQVLLVSSFMASMMAVLITVQSRVLTLAESMRAWMQGAKQMFEAVIVLVLSWGIATVCDVHHLNTAGFFIELTSGYLSASWMPMLAFVLAGFVSFATGSSWSTMGILMPLFISLTYHLILGSEEATFTLQIDPNHHLLLATIGAVLAGAIFGDHCSPISDTTIISSAAAGCDHLDHVSTQLPYALTVGIISLVFGYIPVGLGYSPVIMLPLGVLILYVIVQFYGRPPDTNLTDATDEPDSAENKETTEQAATDELNDNPPDENE